MQSVSPCHRLWYEKKDIIYASIVDHWIVYCKLAQPHTYIYMHPNIHTKYIHIYIYIHIYTYIYIIVHWGAGFQPPSPFLRHSPFDPACPPFFKSLFPLPLFCSTPFQLFQTVPPTLTQPCPALIQLTSLPWFKQISKR